MLHVSLLGDQAITDDRTGSVRTRSSRGSFRRGDQARRPTRRWLAGHLELAPALCRRRLVSRRPL